MLSLLTLLCALGTITLLTWRLNGKCMLEKPPASLCPGPAGLRETVEDVDQARPELVQGAAGRAGVK
eukprot:9480595-Pyramimonas_sp.AAC.1